MDPAADRVSIQSPANGGTLVPTGGLGRKVDLLDGSLRSLGQFTKNRGEIIGLALPLNQG